MRGTLLNDLNILSIGISTALNAEIKMINKNNNSHIIATTINKEGLKQSKHQTMQKVTVIPNGDYTVNVDGELYENIPFSVEIVSNTLKVYYR